MKCDYPDNVILELLQKQLSFFLVSDGEMSLIKTAYPEATERVSHCFAANTNKYYHKDGEVYFNPFHSVQWMIFLYFLSNTLYKKNPSDSKLCDKIYYLNRMLNSVDLFYEVNLPAVFIADHPLGTVIGRGTFGDFFLFSQGCTIGNNKGIFPVLGKNVKMLSNSKIIGNSTIGDNVIIAANTFIKDQNIESDSIVFGTSPDLIIKPNKHG